MNKPWITEEYAALNRQLHETNAGYGAGGHRYAPTIMGAVTAFGAKTVLDFGCGQDTLATVLRANGIDARSYDPAIPGKDATPEPADIVVSTDVAEHVETECVDAYLDELQRLTQKMLFLVVATRPAKKVLSNGQNAHISNYPLEWWLPKLTARFQMSQLIASAGEFTFVGEAK